MPSKPTEYVLGRGKLRPIPDLSGATTLVGLSDSGIVPLKIPEALLASRTSEGATVQLIVRVIDENEHS